jgi:hypothetical protein
MAIEKEGMIDANARCQETRLMSICHSEPERSGGKESPLSPTCFPPKAWRNRAMGNSE